MPTVIIYYCYASGLCKLREWVINGVHYVYDCPDNYDAIFGPVVAKWTVKLKQIYVP